VSIYGQESADYSPDAGGLTIDTSWYGTWLPTIPSLTVASSGRTVSVDAPPQTWYGAAGCEYQISKPVSGTPWYAPAMADTETVYANADSWKGAEGRVYASATQLTQQLPLEDQDKDTPKDTAYKYRARSLTTAYDGSVLYRSEWSAEAAALAKGTGPQDVVAAAIGEAQLKDAAVTNVKIEDGSIVASDKVKANSISTENLNVLAKNLINPFVDGTSEGWTTNGTVVNVDDLGYVLKLSQASGKDFLSNVFTVLPDDIYVFKFGLESLTELSGSLGLYIGLTQGQIFDRYSYHFTDKRWVLFTSGSTNAYFVDNYTTKARKYYTTYILGSRVALSDVPAPGYTDEAYTIRCHRLTGTKTSCRIRSGHNTGQPSDAAWYLIQPQVYRAGSSKLVAENIIAENLSGISANLGRVTGDGNPDDSQYKFVLSDGFSGNENRKGTLLLGAATDAAYLRRWWNGSIWQMAIKLATFIVESIASNIIGRFRVFRTGQNTGTDKPALDANPGSAAGSESTEVRGAFRVRKSTKGDTDGETVMAEILPNGNVNIPTGTLSAKYLGNAANTGGNGKVVNNLSIGNPFDGKGITYLLISKLDGLDAKEQKKGFCGVIYFHRGSSSSYDYNDMVSIVCTKAYDGWKLSNYGFMPTTASVPCVVSYQGEYYLAVKLNSAATHYITLDGHLFGEFVGQVVQDATVVNQDVGKMTAQGGITIPANTPSTSPTTGALTVSGGVGITGALNIGGTASAIRVNGDMIELYQGGVVKTSISVLGVLFSGLLTACSGVLSQGDIKAEIPDPNTPAWTATALPSSASWNKIAYGNGKFIATTDSSNIAAYSTDGVNWMPTTMPNSVRWQGVAYGNGRFVAIAYNNNVAAYSTDGITWTPTTLPSSASWCGIVYGNGKFVAIAYSSNKAAYSEAIILAKLVFNANGTVTWVKT
jgi:hypothetical protein